MKSAERIKLLGRGEWFVTGCVLFLLVSGCATNHAFVSDARFDVPALVAELGSKDED